MPDDRAASTATEDRFEQVLADLLRAEERGERPDLSAFLRTAPELETPLREFFRMRDGFDRLAPHLAPPAARSSALAPEPALPPGNRFAGYEIIRELGRGGMGIVYHARQLSPEREVALKVIRTDRLANLSAEEQRQWLERFRREARVVASLEQHPNLVTLYEVGEHEGRPFFTMQLLRGGNLAETVRGGQRATPGKEFMWQAARLVATVARAVNHVHQRGVLHRDLKPGNILLDEAGRPLVGDFGLARRLDESGSLVAGAIEGTAEYMAPEQARGLPGAVTTAADVYSLGAILYALLTGRPPFKGSNDVETLLLVMGREPTPPRALNPRLSCDLEIICLKCLEKEPGRRYASAAALAEDLDNWLGGRPIVARPVGVAGRLWRWTRREPLLAGAIGSAAVALLAVALVAAGFAIYRGQVNTDLEDAASKLRVALENESNALGKEKDLRGEADTANGLLRGEQRTTRQTSAGLALDQGRRAWQDGDVSKGLLWMARSLTLAPDDDAALQEAIRINLAAWRATVPPPHAPLRHPGIVARAGFTPDGTRLVALTTGTVSREDKVMPDGTKGNFLVYRPETPGDDSLGGGAAAIPTFDNLFRPSPRRVATPRGQVFLWDVQSEKSVELRPPGGSQVLAVTPDGARALTAKRQDQRGMPSSVQLWDLIKGKPIGETAKLNLSVRWAACSGDGKTFATMSDASFGTAWLMLWDAQTGKRTDFQLGSAPTAAALSPDGQVLAVVTPSRRGGGATVRLSLLPGMPQPAAPGEIELYDLAARKQLPALPGAWPRNQVDSQAAVAVGPGGRLVLTVSPSDTLKAASVRLWDREANKSISLPYQNRVAFAQFSPDGKVLLTASGRGRIDLAEVVQLWDTATGRPRGAPLLPRGPLQTAAFSSDSKLLAIGCGEGEVLLWEAGSGRPLGRPLRHPGPIHALAFSPDGTKFVTSGYDGLARIWDTQPTRAVPPLRLLERIVVISADGSRCLQRGEDKKTLRLYETASGQACGASVPLTGEDRGVALSPDNRTLAISQKGNTARLWDAVTGQPIGKPLSQLGPVTGMRFSPDGRTLLTFVASPIAISSVPITYRWNAATGDSQDFEKDPHVSLAQALSPDGRWALRTLGTSAVLVGIGEGQGGTHSLEHRGAVTGALFSSDSRMVLTTAVRSGSWEEARLWDVATGKPVGAAMLHQGPIRAKAFRPDGKMVLTGSDDGTARLWDAATGKPLGPLMSHGGRIRAVAFDPQGLLAATAGDDGTARLWHVATGLPLGPPLLHPAGISLVAFAAGGDLLITAAGDERVRVWPISKAIPGDPRRLQLEAELETGLVLDNGTPRLLDDAERAQRGEQLKGAEQPPPVEDRR